MKITLDEEELITAVTEWLTKRGITPCAESSATWFTWFYGDEEASEPIEFSIDVTVGAGDAPTEGSAA